MKNKITIIMVLSLTLLSTVYADTYYVAKNGEDTNNGSKEFPLLTINKALSVAYAGDTVFVREGVYPEYVTISHDGTSSFPIVISSYPGEHAILDGTGNESDDPWGYSDILCYVKGDYIVIKNIEAKNAAGFGFYVRSNHVTFENVYIHNGYLAGIYFYKCNYGRIANCMVHDIYDYGDGGTGGGGNGDAIGSSAGNGNDYPEYGHHIIENNIVFNASDDCIDVWTSQYNTIRGNIIRHAGYSNPSNGGSKSFNEPVGDGNGFKLGKGGNNTIIYNVAYDMKSDGFDSNSGDNLTLYNNTAYDCAEYSFCMYDDSLIIKNCISYECTRYHFHSDAIDEYNTWNYSIPNPRFLSTDVHSPLFLHLKSNSSCIDKGQDIGFPYLGSAPDLGAYEYDAALENPKTGNNTIVTGRWANTYTTAVTARNDFVYFGDGDLLQIAEINAEGLLVKKGKIQFMNVMRDIALTGNYAYAVVDYFGLYAIDISNPSNPQKISLFDTGDFAWSVAVDDNYAYVANGLSGLQIIDISDPASPAEVSSFTTGGFARNVTVSGKYLFVADLWNGMRILDKSDPDNLQEIGFFNTNSYVQDIFVDGNRAFVTCSSGYLCILDISDPVNPQEISSYNIGSPARNVYINNEYAYVTAGEDGLHIININDIENPAEAGAFDTDKFAENISVNGVFACVADGMDGLYVVKSTVTSSIANEKKRIVAAEFRLEQNYPNPFNPSTTIKYSLHRETKIVIDVFNMLGRKVANLVNGKKSAGEHIVKFEADGLANGVYVYRLRTNNGFTLTKKMILLK